MAGSRISAAWLAWIVIAATPTALAQDTVIHAGTLLDGTGAPSRHAVSILVHDGRIGAADRIGTIQPGRYADLVATAGDPLAEPAQFGQVQFVMKGGIVYREHGAPIVH